MKHLMSAWNKPILGIKFSYGDRNRNIVSLSVVIPYFGCEGSLEELCESLNLALSQLQTDSEVIFILDGPNGGSWKYLLETTEKYGYSCHRLTRNFGQHAATKAGLSLSTGSKVIVMDCDLQDPPSLIPELVARATDEVDVVYAKRRGRYDKFSRRIMRIAANSLLKMFYPKGFDLDTGSYMLLKRVVVDEVLAIKDNSHVGLVVNWLNFPSVSVSYERDRRAWGKSNYSLRTLFGHGIEALSFNLVYFFRKLVGISIIASVSFSFVGAIALLRALTAQTSSGWASIFVLLTIGFSMTLTLLSLVGFTIADKFSNRNLPIYLIRKENQG
jgi:dolichol-phosphate mannosyltransferase